MICNCEIAASIRRRSMPLAGFSTFASANTRAQEIYAAVYSTWAHFLYLVEVLLCLAHRLFSSLMLKIKFRDQKRNGFDGPFANEEYG